MAQVYDLTKPQPREYGTNFRKINENYKLEQYLHWKKEEG